MSIVELRVELPSYSHSFLIQVPLSYTILEVKGEITRSCPGAPRADGQRIIWRGRVLRDEEKVEDIWKSLEDSRVIHLAVNPSAWTADPPPAISAVMPSSPPLPPVSSYFSASQPGQSGQTPQSSPVTPLTRHAPYSQDNHPMAFVIWAHQNAILALISFRVALRPESTTGRSSAVSVVEKNGYSWPAILDESYPGADADGRMSALLPEGVRYEPANVDGQTFLHLQNPGATPNIFQAHALKVLTHTFPLLALPIPPATTTTTTTTHLTNTPITVPREVNQLLQQLGLPPLRVPGAAPERRNIFMRDIPIRPLLAPFMMLMIRTLLLVYFVSPTRKPLFGLLVGAWIVYEAWGPLRAALNGAAERQAAQAGPLPAPQQPQDGAAPAAARQAPDQTGAGAAQQPRAQAPGGAARVPDRTAAARHVAQADAIIDSLANINLPTETQILAAPEGVPPADEPGLAHKVSTFFTLLLLTLHPAVWNRRRVLLKQREGRLRTEANARERVPTTPAPNAPADGEGAEDEAQRAERERVAAVRAELVATNARRPRWVQDYVERARGGEWVDD